MRWRRTLTLSALLAAVPAVAQAQTELSVGDRLKDRREVAAGTRAYSVGFQDGRFYANGWHITGEMGGIWAPPLKLADGVWFGVDDAWVGEATKFTSGRGYVRYDLPRRVRPEAAAHGLRPRRQARRALRARADQPGRRAEDRHGQGRRAFGADDRLPVGVGRRRTAGEGQRRRHRGDVQRGALVVQRRRRHARSWPPTAAPTAPRPAPATGARSPARSAPADSPGAAAATATTARSARAPAASCATRSRSARRSTRRSGSRSRPPAATSTARCATRAASSRRRPARARGSASTPSSTCPATGQLQEAVDWGKQNLADLTQTATDLNLRFVDEGKAVPAADREDPEGHVLRRRLPGLPVAVRHRRRVHGVRGGRARPVRDGQGAPGRAARHLATRSTPAPARSRTRSSPTARSDYGANTSAGNTDETAKFPSAVALIWRWTGDDRFRDSLYDFSVRNLKYIVATLDEDGDGWPEGLGNVERPGMGPEKLDNTVYFIRGLYDLADMADAKRDRATERWASELADQLRARFDPQWWDAAEPAVRRLAQRDQRADPAEALDRRHADGGRADRRRRRRARPRAGRPRRRRAGRARDAVLQRRRRRSTPASSTPAAAAARRAPASRSSSRSTPRSRPSARATTAARRGQQRYTDANAVPMFEPDEQPGALPEVLPSPGQNAEHRPLLDVPLDGHAGLGPLRHGVAGGPPATRRAARRWAPAGSTSCRRCRTASRASPGATSGSVTARSTCRPSAAALHDGDRAHAPARAQHRPDAEGRSRGRSRSTAGPCASRTSA